MKLFLPTFNKLTRRGLLTGAAVFASYHALADGLSASVSPQSGGGIGGFDGGISGGGGTILFVGPGDVKSGWTAWWGLRAFTTATCGTACVDIYDTVSTTTQTFNTLANGDLDKAGIAAFLGAHPGKIAKLWDKTGNGWHLIQATPANMPDYIPNAESLGGALPAMKFTSANSQVLASSANGVTGALGTMSVVAMAIRDDNGASYRPTLTSGSAGMGILFPGLTNSVEGFAGTLNTIPCLNHAQHSIEWVFNGATSIGCVDGNVTSGINIGSNNFSGGPFRIGTAPFATALDGLVSEAGFHPSLFTAPECQALSANKLGYWLNSSTYEGIVATRCRRLINADGTNKFVMSRSGHIATEALSEVMIAFENQNGATATITQSVEYPAGTFTQIKWRGATSYTFSGIYTTFSDYAAISIPAGAIFWVRTYYQAPSGGGVFYNQYQNSFYSEVTTLSTTALTDQTMGGTITNSGAFTMPPIGIIGVTSNPSWYITGDSIAAGQGDNEDTSNTITGNCGKIGTIARSLGNVPFVNVARSGSTGLPSAATEMLGKASHVVNEVVINNLNAGTTAAVLLASIKQMFLWLRPKQRRYQTTVTPQSTGSWSTLVAQTTVAQNAEHINFNTALRNSTSGLTLTGVIDTCAVLESSQDSGLWIVSPSPPYTADGLHPNPAGYLLVAAANTVPAAVWP